MSTFTSQTSSSLENLRSSAMILTKHCFLFPMTTVRPLTLVIYMIQSYHWSSLRPMVEPWSCGEGITTLLLLFGQQLPPLIFQLSFILRALFQVSTLQFIFQLLARMCSSSRNYQSCQQLFMKSPVSIQKLLYIFEVTSMSAIQTARGSVYLRCCVANLISMRSLSNILPTIIL